MKRCLGRGNTTVYTSLVDHGGDGTTPVSNPPVLLALYAFFFSVDPAHVSHSKVLMQPNSIFITIIQPVRRKTCKSIVLEIISISKDTKLLLIYKYWCWIPRKHDAMHLPFLYRPGFDTTHLGSLAPNACETCGILGDRERTSAADELFRV